MIETKVTQSIYKILKSHSNRIWFRKIHGSAIHSGIPDIIGCCNGRSFAIEVKAGHNKATARQEIEMKRILMSDGVAIVTSDTKDITRMINEILTGKNKSGFEISFSIMGKSDSYSAKKWHKRMLKWIDRNIS